VTGWPGVTAPTDDPAPPRPGDNAAKEPLSSMTPTPASEQLPMSGPKIGRTFSKVTP